MAFFLYLHHRVQGPTQLSVQLIQEVVTPRANLPGCKDDHSLPSGAEVRNAWSYTSTPPQVFMSWCLVKYWYNFTFSTCIADIVKYAVKQLFLYPILRIMIRAPCS